MNVIDSLVVTLGFDTVGVKKGEKETTESLKKVRDEGESTAKEMESRGAQAAQFFGQIQNKVIGLAAAYIGLGAAKAELIGVTNATADLGRAAAVTGANVSQLSAFGNFIARAGGSAATAVSQVENFNQAIARAKQGLGFSSELQRFLGTIGAGREAFSGDWFGVIEKLADYADKNRNDPNKVRTIASLGGFGDDYTVSELLKGKTAFNKDYAESARLGLADKGAADAARDLQSSFVGLKQATDTYARDLVTRHAPAVEKALSGLTGWVARGGLGYLGEGALTGFVASGFDPFGAIVGGAVGAFATPGAPGASTSQGSFGGPSSLSFGSAGNQGGDVLSLFRRLENSGDSAVSSKGAIGRYQILPATAREYGFDPSKLKDPVYNTMVARAILSDLSRRYNGNLNDIAVAYQSGPGAANRFIASGRNASVLGPQGQAYLAHEQLLSAGGQFSGLGAATTITNTTTIGQITINTKATDATGIAKDLRGVIAQNSVANQANTGLR